MQIYCTLFKQDSVIWVDSLNTTHPLRGQKQHGHLEVVFWKGSNSHYFFNSTAEIFENLGRQKQIISVFTPQSKNDRTTEKYYFQSVFDACKSGEHRITTKLLKSFIEGYSIGADHLFGKSLKYDTYHLPTWSFLSAGCKTPKGIYTSTNFTFDDSLMISLKMQKRFRMEFKFLALKPNNKTWVHLYTIHSRGSAGNAEVLNRIE